MKPRSHYGDNSIGERLAKQIVKDMERKARLESMAPRMAEAIRAFVALDFWGHSGDCVDCDVCEAIRKGREILAELEGGE